MGFFSQLAGDFVFMRGVLRSLRMTTHIAKNPERIFPDVVEELAGKYGDKIALLSEREQFTYRELFERSNRYSRWALAEDLQKGDAVCLLMPNRPDYLAIWIGITRTGGVTALLNTNLVGPSLAHCIDVAAPKHIIVAAELAGPFLAVLPSLKSKPKIWIHGETKQDFPRIDRAIENFPAGALSGVERRPLTIEDRALYIYTSGTTGMPKAANINHYRVMLAACAFAGIMNTKPTDRMYDCLPMYHTVGGLVATGAVLLNGGAVVIR
ncbi:MAG: AMP-binding protein, partial [Pseudorhodoplanes sp.]